jgi:hypothetical protein
MAENVRKGRIQVTIHLDLRDVHIWTVRTPY